MMAVHRFQDHNTIGGETPAEKEKLAKQVEKYKEEAEQVGLDRDMDHGSKETLMFWSR